MAEKYIVNMPLKTTPDDTDLMIIEDAQDTKRITWANVVKPIEDLVAAHEAEKATQSDLGHIKLQEPWKDAVLQNGWTGTLQYAKNDLGQLVIKGLIKGGTISANTIIATLPSGYQTNYRAIIMAQVVQNANGVPLLYMNNASGYLRLTANHGVVSDQDCHIFAILDIN